MRSTVFRLLDPVFGHPRGLAGRVGAAMMSKLNAKTENYLVDQAKLGGDETVLVIGPGPGVGLRAVAEATPNGRVVGVEPAELMRRQATQRCAEYVRAGRVQVTDGTAERTGQPDGSVDVVFSTNNVQLWPDRPAALAELHRVLRPGGSLVVSVHARVALDITPDLLRREAERAGFTDVQSYLLASSSPIGASLQLRGVRPA